MKPAESRSHETRVTIDAPLKDVWTSISTAAGLARWFAPNMTVEPGPGGFVLADWGPGLEWRTAIEVWEPNQQLRLVETRDHMLAPQGLQQAMTPCRLVQDYYLETEDGKTVLRLVHSGFGIGSDWDNEYEGTRGGWAICFFRLQEGLEHHRGQTVRNLHFGRTCLGWTAAEVLERLDAAMPKSLESKMRTEYERAGILPELNRAVFNYNTQPVTAGAIAYIGFVLFDLSDAQASAIEAEWSGKLEELFPAHERQNTVS